MRIRVADAVSKLVEQGALVRRRSNQSDRVIPHIADLIGQPLHEDLQDLYREHIHSVGDYNFDLPYWNDWPGIGWHKSDYWVKNLLHVQAVPIAGDDSGNYYGVDLSGDDYPAVYIFDHERNYEIEACVGSSIGAFLLILAKEDQAHDESWPEGWQLKIDPDIEKCPRAPPPWKVPLPWAR